MNNAGGWHRTRRRRAPSDVTLRFILFFFLLQLLSDTIGTFIFLFRVRDWTVSNPFFVLLFSILIYTPNRDRHETVTTTLFYVIMHVNATRKEQLCVTHHLMQPVVYLNNMSLHNILQWNTDGKDKYF